MDEKKTVSVDIGSKELAQDEVDGVSGGKIVIIPQGDPVHKNDEGGGFPAGIIPKK